MPSVVLVERHLRVDGAQITSVRLAVLGHALNISSRLMHLLVVLVFERVDFQRPAMILTHINAVKVDQVGVAPVAGGLIRLLRLLCLMTLILNLDYERARPIDSVLRISR